VNPASGDARDGGALFALVVALLLVAAVGLGSPWTATLDRADSRVVSDFQILHAAGRGLVEGRDIHDPAVLDEIGRRDGRPATPFCAANPLVVRTYGLLADRDVHAAYRFGLLVNGALALLAVALLANVVRALGAGADNGPGKDNGPGASDPAGRRRGVSPWLALAIGLAALGLGEGLWMSLAMNTTNLLALVALLGALHAAYADRPVLEGACLAVAIVAKTSPVLMLLVVLLAGRRRAALSGALVVILLGVASVAWSGWAVHESWLLRVLPALGYAPELEVGSFNNSLHTWNLSPNGVLSRAILQAGAPRIFALLGAWLVTGLVLVQLIGGLRARSRGEADKGQRGTRARDPAAYVREYALGATAMLLVSSVTWPHHLVFLAIPSVWLLWRLTPAAAKRMPLASTLTGLLCVVVLSLPLGTLDTSPDLAVGIPVRTAALVVLFAVLVPRELSPPSAAPEGASP
jgi:hypothetical protein